MKGDAIRMKRDFIETAMTALRRNMKLNRKTEILSLQFHFFSVRKICNGLLNSQQNKRLSGARLAHFEGFIHAEPLGWRLRIGKQYKYETLLKEKSQEKRLEFKFLR